ncbi:MAG TPA: tetratricopeptide repeat protein [Candidatus Polarisedimenticolaceae bacterium]|nr:tetratricopeptide repeat protein [Candidatus Polarisedimenticolaceae bacterium]
MTEDTYEAWSRAGADATRRGDFDAALSAYSRARAAAERDGDERQEQGAALNLAMVRLQTDSWRDADEGLREILLRATDPGVAYRAAYHLASSLRRQSRHERALSYARRAMERARELGTTEYLAPAHNLLGNIHLAQSRIEEALAEYRRSLALRLAQPEDTRFSQAILQENIGYCLLLLQQMPEGIAHLEEGLALSEEVDDKRCRAECLQDLCYGMLLTARYDLARERGEAALALAESQHYGDIRENCHYLLGEVGTRTGDADLRDDHLDRLQALHPELPFLRDFLSAVDITSVLSLKR